MPTPEDILKIYWGYTSFRDNQHAVIGSVLQQKDTLVLMPTGGGKSLCYQIPSLLHNGLTLVISPLIALMEEQVKQLRAREVPAAQISSGMHRTEVERILRNASEQAYDLLYLSPERIQTDLFKEYLPVLDIKLIAVDEAHCVSQWGHDFRPDYLKISLLKKLFPKVPVIALTASATPEVEADIIKQLQLKQPQIFKQSFERKNINYSIIYTEKKTTDLVELLSATDSSSIIYCRSRKQTEVLSIQLQQNGINAIAYHAGMNHEKRAEHQALWTENKAPVIVATNAFGMGIDKADVRLVVHYDVPEHMEAFYQESGRAGRDGLSAQSVLYYDHYDLRKLSNSTELQFPPIDFLRRVYQSVAEYLQIPTGTEPYRYYDFELVDFCNKFKLPVLQTSRALKLLEQEDLWTITDAVFKPTTLQIIANRQELDNIGRAYPDLGLITTTLLRLYGTLFYQPTIVNLKLVAKHLRIRLHVVEQLITQLHKMEVLQYNQPKQGAQMFFHHYRVRSNELIINTERILALKLAHKKRTDAMIQFVSNNNCHNQTLLAYFGEEVHKPCGHCDICNAKNTPNTNSLKEEILNLLNDRYEMFVTDLVSRLSKYNKDDVLSAVRILIDEQVLELKDNNIITKKRSR